MDNNIKLSKIERNIINLFTWYDRIDAHGIREYLTSKPSAFDSYFKKYNAVTPSERLDAIRKGKEEKTLHLISAKQKYGKIPKRMVKTQSKSLCGFLRLLVAYNHKNN